MSSRLCGSTSIELTWKASKSELFCGVANESASGMCPYACHSQTTSPVRTSTSWTIESSISVSFPAGVPGT